MHDRRGQQFLTPFGLEWFPSMDKAGYDSNALMLGFDAEGLREMGDADLTELGANSTFPLAIELASRFQQLIEMYERDIGVTP